MLYRNALSLIALVTLMACQSPSNSNEQAEETPLKMIWSDEFEEAGLPNPDNWTYDLGDACNLPAGCGWGNNEKQYYTAANLKNARIEKGHLIIEAHQEAMGTAEYTSARLVSKGKFEFKYGRVEVKAKLPSGRGTWPAIWMLPVQNKYGGWPRSGEVDIMEHVGFEPDSIFGTVHTEVRGPNHGASIYIPDAESKFHIYAIDWSADQIDFSVDKQVYFSYPNLNKGSETWPFDESFYLILNIAVGGNWGGKQGLDPDIWPQKMEIDYVRFYQ